MKKRITLVVLLTTSLLIGKSQKVFCIKDENNIPYKRAFVLVGEKGDSILSNEGCILIMEASKLKSSYYKISYLKQLTPGTIRGKFFYKANGYTTDSCINTASISKEFLLSKKDLNLYIRRNTNKVNPIN